MENLSDSVINEILSDGELSSGDESEIEAPNLDVREYDSSDESADEDSGILNYDLDFGRITHSSEDNVSLPTNSQSTRPRSSHEVRPTPLFEDTPGPSSGFQPPPSVSRPRPIANLVNRGSRGRSSVSRPRPNVGPVSRPTQAIEARPTPTGIDQTRPMPNVGRGRKRTAPGTTTKRPAPKKKKIDEDVNYKVYEKSDADFPMFQYTLQSGYKAPPGIKPETPLQFFQLFFSDELINSMINETNRYASVRLAKAMPFQRRSIWNTWSEINLEEMKAFLGLVLNMGLNPKGKLQDYFPQQ